MLAVHDGAVSSRLARFVVHRPILVLVIALGLALAVAPLVLTRLRLDTELINLVPGSSPEAAAFLRFTRVFGGEQPLVAVVECADPETLTAFADRYAERLRSRPDVIEVRSRLSGAAATLLRTHLIDLLDDEEFAALAARTSDEALQAQAKRLRSLIAAPGGSALVPMLTADPLELLFLVSKRLSAGLPVDAASGYFKSPDGKALLLFIRPTTNPFDVEADRSLVEGVSAVARGLGARVVDGDFGAPGATPEVGFTGVYAHAFVYRDWLHHDVGISTIVSAVEVLLFFALLLGAVRALPLVALPLHFGLWMTAAAAAAIYGRVNAVSLAFGSILLSIGIDLPIQIYNRLREELLSHPPKVALLRTIERLAGPALLATLGPAAVFFACWLSDYRGLAELGVLAGVGLLLNMATMLTVFPALLGVIPAAWWVPRDAAPATGNLLSRAVRRLESFGRTDGRWFAAFGRATAKRPRRVLLLVSLLALAASPLALRVRFERRLISSVEPAGMPAVKVQREMERRFGERHQLMIALVDDADFDRALARSDAWRAEAERMRRSGLIASYESVSTLLPSLAEQERRRARFARLDPNRIARTLSAALESAGFDLDPFRPFLASLVHPGPPLRLGDLGDELGFLLRGHVNDKPGRRLVATYLYPSPGQLDPAVTEMKRIAAQSWPGGDVTGIPVLEEALRRVVERDTVRVSAASVIAVVLILSLYYRRVKPVLAVLLPLSFAWLFFAIALGALQIPLNLFNLLAVPLVIGYGIDDHVFLVHRFEEEPERGPERALASTGRAIVVTSLSTMAGFAGLIAARFDGLRLLGISGTLAVGLCLIAAMAVLPALLSILWGRRS